jgi:hypothetical protein
MAATDGLVLLRNSERATYRRCRLKWQWSYERRLSPQRDSGALTFGSLVHGALEHYYPPGRKRGVHPAKTFADLYKEYGDFSQWDEDENKVDALELGVSMLTEYVDLYGKDDGIYIVQPEQAVQVDVYDRQDNYVCTWVGVIDAVYVDLLHSSRSRKVFRLLEHKTAKTIDETMRVNSGYGEQALSYFWATDLWLHHEELLPEDQHLEGVTFNWLRKALPDNRPVNEDGHALNKDGSVSKLQPKPLLVRYPMDFGPDELSSINKRIRAEAWEIAQVKAGKLPIYKNPTRDCAWDCPFVEACELHEMGSDYEDMLRYEFIHWNPYEAHELAEEKT